MLTMHDGGRSLLSAIVTMHIDNPLGLSPMPHSHGKHWLSVKFAYWVFTPGPAAA